MQSKRGFFVLLGITVAVVLAAVWSQRAADESPDSLGLQVPDLAAGVDAVQTVLLRTADTFLRLKRTDDGWVATSKDGYPADVDRIRQLVLGISRLQRLEKKTSDPEKLADLELRDVDQAGSGAVQITLLSGNERELANLLVGKTHEFRSSGRSRYFVRDAGSPQSWLVEGSLPPVLEDVSKWLEQRLLPGVGEADLRSVRVTHADGETVAIRRELRDEDFQLIDIPDGKVVDSQYSVNAIAQTFRRLSLEDVKKAQSSEPGNSAVTVDALTFNGVRIVASIERLDPDYGVRLTAGYEPGDFQTGDAEQEQGADGEQLAEDLNKRWRDRLFIVAQHALDPVTARQSELVKEPEPSGTD